MMKLFFSVILGAILTAYIMAGCATEPTPGSSGSGWWSPAWGGTNYDAR